MNGYLGEFPVDSSTNPFSDYSPAEWAMYFIEKYGQIDGDHHKAWVLDQVAQILNGTRVDVVEARWTDHPKEYRVSVGPPSPGYLVWRMGMQGAMIDGEPEYDYYEGIAP